MQLASAGIDVDVTPRLKAIGTANYIRLDATQSVEAILFQGNIHKTLGTDISLGLRYRPLLNQNIVYRRRHGGVPAGPRIQRHLRKEPTRSSTSSRT